MQAKLVDFQCVVLDLDFTIWTGCRPGFWARLLIPPLTVDSDRNVITDCQGNTLTLIPGVRRALSELKKREIPVGFITRGGDLGVSYDDQLPVQCIRLFDLAQYFTHQTEVLFRTDKKSRVFTPLGNTVFVDDSEQDRQDISDTFPAVTCLNSLTLDWCNQI